MPSHVTVHQTTDSINQTAVESVNNGPEPLKTTAADQTTARAAANEDQINVKITANDSDSSDTVPKRLTTADTKDGTLYYPNTEKYKKLKAV